MNLELIKNEFDNYVKLYDMSNYDINYKYRHSYRVYKLCERISKDLNLNTEDILLCSVIGLLHDIGRFEQLKEFSSYKDANLDHADLGVKLLFEESLIDKFNIDSKYYDIIEFAIRNHNKYEIEKTNDNRKLMFAKIIRDADKIDIIKASVIYDDFKINECERDISKEIEKTFFRNKQIKVNDIKNENDETILLLAFLFDINYSASLKIIRDENLVDKFYSKIKNKELFKPYVKHMKEYIKER